MDITQVLTNILITAGIVYISVFSVNFLTKPMFTRVNGLFSSQLSMSFATTSALVACVFMLLTKLISSNNLLSEKFTATQAATKVVNTPKKVVKSVPEGLCENDTYDSDVLNTTGPRCGYINVKGASLSDTPVPDKPVASQPGPEYRQVSLEKYNPEGLCDNDTYNSAILNKSGTPCEYTDVNGAKIN